MCFDLDSTPPLPQVAGVTVERRSLNLKAADGNTFRAYHAIPGERNGAAIIILPDIRGLHHYYEELALRFAELGFEALAIDYFGRTAGLTERGDDFDYGPHVAQTTWAGISADLSAAAAHLREQAVFPKSLFTIGFCMGGRNAFNSASLELGLAGVIGFYGFPGGASRNGSPAPTDLVGEFECPVLGIFGGADKAIPIATIGDFRTALDRAGIANEIAVEPDAPHSFFDRKQAEFAVQSDDAWNRVRKFLARYAAV